MHAYTELCYNSITIALLFNYIVVYKMICIYQYNIGCTNPIFTNHSYLFLIFVSIILKYGVYDTL